MLELDKRIEKTIHEIKGRQRAISIKMDEEILKAVLQ